MSRVAGEIQWFGPSGTLIRDTQTCVHCGGGWIIDSNGPEHGFCRKCYGPTCNRQGCIEQCLHWEKEMELVELGTRNQTEIPLRCAHCNSTWVTRSGSGIERGFCFACNGHLCGAPGCFTHPDRLSENRWAFEMIEPIARL